MALAGHLRTKLLTHTFVGRDMLHATGAIAVVGLDGGAKLFDLLICPAGVCNNFHVKAFLHTD